MKHEDALKLMEVMIQLEYYSECIVMTLINCEAGMGIGHALMEAISTIRNMNNEQ